MRSKYINPQFGDDELIYETFSLPRSRPLMVSTIEIILSLKTINPNQLFADVTKCVLLCEL